MGPGDDVALIFATIATPSGFKPTPQRGVFSPLHYSCANVSTLSGLSSSSLSGDQRKRARVKSLPATRMDRQRRESLRGRRLKAGERRN